MTQFTANANRGLVRVAKVGLAVAGEAAAEKVALGVWHGDEPPSLVGAEGPHRADAVYLLGRLAYYNIVPQERKRMLLGQVRLARQAEGQSTDTTPLELIFRSYLPRLQPLQTRHYRPPSYGDDEPFVQEVSAAELWADKRARQARDLELVRSGRVKARDMGWFTLEMAQSAKAIDSPY